MHLRHCPIVTSSTLKTKTVAKNLLDDLIFFLSTAIIFFLIPLNYSLILLRSTIDKFIQNHDNSKNLCSD